MKIHYTVTLAMLAGFGLGAVAVQGLHAQAKPPAYYVAEIDVANEDVYNKEWAPKVAETIKAAGGSYLARGTSIQGIEGTPPRRIVISKWDNIDKVKAWRESAVYKSALPIRDKAVKSVRAYAVEGITN
jgi:uncharacterized protein (DUF1330 family)